MKNRSVCFTAWCPSSTCTFITHLNNVVLDRHSSIILWSFPFKVAITCCHVLHSEWTYWCTWNIKNNNLHICRVSAIDILSSDCHNSIFFPCCSTDNQLCVVFGVGYLDLFGNNNFFLIYQPLLLWCWLTSNIDIKSEWFSSFASNLIEIGSINPWRNIPCFTGNRTSLIRGHTLTSSIDSSCSEFIGFSLSKIRNSAFKEWSRNLMCSCPLTWPFVLLLNQIVGNFRSAIIKWTLPFKINRFLIPINNFKINRRTWLTKWILCKNIIRHGAWVRFPFFIYSTYSEFVFLHSSKTLDIKLAIFRSTTWNP